MARGSGTCLERAYVNLLVVNTVHTRVRQTQTFGRSMERSCNSESEPPHIEDIQFVECERTFQVHDEFLADYGIDLHFLTAPDSHVILETECN